jgi:hypothetical protein
MLQLDLAGLPSPSLLPHRSDAASGATCVVPGGSIALIFDLTAAHVIDWCCEIRKVESKTAVLAQGMGWPNAGGVCYGAIV